METKTAYKILALVAVIFIVVTVSSLIIQTYEPTLSTNLALDVVKEKSGAWETLRGYQVIKSVIYLIDTLIIAVVFLFLFLGNFLKSSKIFKQAFIDKINETKKY